MGYKAYWAKKKSVYVPKEMTAKEVKVYIDTKVYDFLNELKNGENGLPLSRYIQIAIDNEMDQEKPFNYPMKFDDETHFEDKYAHEANMIFDFVRKYSYKGISLMMLMLLRRSVGIESRERIYRGYIELLNSGLVEEVYPKDKTFVFPKWYRKLVIKGRVTT